MKKYFLLILVLCFVTACNQKSNRSNSVDTTTQQDSTTFDAEEKQAPHADWEKIDRKGYAIYYPKDWMQKPDVENTEFFLYSPQMDENDRFRENISLVVEELKDKDYDLSKYVKAALKMLHENIIESKRIVRAGRDCQMIVYTQDFPDKFTTKNELYIWVKNEKAYVLAFSYVIEKDNEAQEVGNEILLTFKLK